jgi:hypothetical protein
LAKVCQGGCAEPGPRSPHFKSRITFKSKSKTLWRILIDTVRRPR